MLTEQELSILAAYTTAGLLNVGHTIVPEPSVRIINDLLVEGALVGSSDSDDTAEPLAVAERFINEFEMNADLIRAKEVRAGGTLAVDPGSIALVAGLWILLQTKVEIRLVNSKEGQRWTATIKKEATDSEVILELFNRIRHLLGG